MRPGACIPCNQRLHADIAPIGMRNMAKYRTPTLVEPVAMAFPTADRVVRQAMWIDRSFVLAEDHVTQTERRKVAN